MFYLAVYCHCFDNLAARIKYYTKIHTLKKKCQYENRKKSKCLTFRTLPGILLFCSVTIMHTVNTRLCIHSEH